MWYFEVASTLKPHRRTKSESDAKRKGSSAAAPDAKRPKLEKRRGSKDEPPNERKPPEVRMKDKREGKRFNLIRCFLCSSQALMILFCSTVLHLVGANFLISCMIFFYSLENNVVASHAML